MYLLFIAIILSDFLKRLFGNVLDSLLTNREDALRLWKIWAIDDFGDAKVPLTLSEEYPVGAQMRHYMAARRYVWRTKEGVRRRYYLVGDYNRYIVDFRDSQKPVKVAIQFLLSFWEGFSPQIFRPEVANEGVNHYELDVLLFISLTHYTKLV